MSADTWEEAQVRLGSSFWSISLGEESFSFCPLRRFAPHLPEQNHQASSFSQVAALVADGRSPPGGVGAEGLGQGQGLLLPWLTS